ncbi:MAG: PAS domain-containing sensor histidine kinase, partial [Deltaproteobacteria bacterium]|nr:PAS domain-containing sensor histidine kinase [Deltaproteobacteria bacterium]
MEPSRGRVKGYLAGRSLVLVLLLVLAAVLEVRHGGYAAPFRWFFAVTALSFAFTILSAVALRGGRPRAWASRLQPAWDVAYASVLVFLTGGTVSPLASLYSLAIIGGAILLFRRGALVTATASSLAFGVLANLEFYGLVTPLNPYPIRFAEAESIALQLVFNLVAFYSIALLSGYLAEELRKTGERLEQAEAEVLDLEHLKESILESLGSGVVALDPSGREVFHNRAAEELLGRAHARLGHGTDVGKLFDLSPQRRSEAAFDQGRVALGYTVSPLVNRSGTPRGSILIFQDLSEVKRLEEDLRRADRLAAVGRLAAGLAHEVRNPLASLSGSVEMLRANLSPGPDDGQLFAIVLRETERLNRLVTNFLHYARPETSGYGDVDLSALVDDTVFFFLQGEGREGFSLENRVPPNTIVRGDRGQLEQLLLNLLRNSREAAPEGVHVTVDAAAEADGVRFTVCDDGPGVPPEVAERVFEPFFSGREGGTGLGLATVHRIAG